MSAGRYIRETNQSDTRVTRLHHIKTFSLRTRSLLQAPLSLVSRRPQGRQRVVAGGINIRSAHRWALLWDFHQLPAVV